MDMNDIILVALTNILNEIRMTNVFIESYLCRDAGLIDDEHYIDMVKGFRDIVCREHKKS